MSLGAELRTTPWSPLLREAVDAIDGTSRPPNGRYVISGVSFGFPGRSGRDTVMAGETAAATAAAVGGGVATAATAATAAAAENTVGEGA